MFSLLAAVFVLQCIIYMANSAGAATLNELAWVLYNRLPTSTAEKVSNSLKLRQKLLSLKKELAAVSAQDDFAKWAKLRRQHDKVAAEHEKASESMQASRTRFDSTVGITRWLATSGLRFFLQFWWTKTPIFWLPGGLAPGYVEWVVSFPRAPLGSISIQVWFITCAAIINMAGDMIRTIKAFGTSHEVRRKKEQ